jgi:4'-phosphopantetheinyl transferase
VVTSRTKPPGGSTLSNSIEWVSVLAPPPLWPSEIHIWLQQLSLSPPALALLHSSLSEDEKQRASLFQFDRDRVRFVAARGTLRTILAQYLKTPQAKIRLCYGKQGKPFLPSDANGETLNFNLSHSQDVAIFAFGRDRDIGIDVENIRTDFDYEELARHNFSVSEKRSLDNLPSKSRADGFYLCWTRKEAYIKARGEGLQISLDSFDVNLDPGVPAKFLRGVDSNWKILSFAAEKQYPAALVYRGALAEVRFFTLEKAARTQD